MKSIVFSTFLLFSPLFAAPPATADPDGAAVIDLHFDSHVVVYGPERGCRFGEGLAAGDFDGDGIDDLLISAPWSDGPGGERANCGKVYLFFGSPDRREEMGEVDAAEADVVFTGARREDQLGRRLSAADLDGDGRDDLVLGTMYGDADDGARRNCGQAFIFFGRSRDRFEENVDLAESAADVTVSGADEKDFLAGEMCTGDIDGDGLGDLILGAFYGDGPDDDRYHAGEAVIIFGRERKAFPAEIDLAKDPNPTIYGAEATDTFGRSLAAGDLDGDGRDELIVGAYYADGPENTRINAGETYLFFGRNRYDFDKVIDLADSTEVVISGEWDGDVSGRSVATADMDGDGLDDLLISAHKSSAEHDLDPSGDQGRIYVIYGAPRDRIPGRIDLRRAAPGWIVGGERSDNLGWPLAAGACSPDGATFLLAGAKQADGEDRERTEAGAAYLVGPWKRSDLAGGIPIDSIASLTIIGADPKDYTPFDAVLFDWDGDGRCEAALGVPSSQGKDGNSPQTGEVSVVFTED